MELERADDEIDILYIDDMKLESNRSLERTRRSQKKGEKKNMKKVKTKMKHETWELFYPDGTSSLMNYNPLVQERKQTLKEVLKLIKAWNGYGDDRFPEGEIKELVKEIKKLSKPSQATDSEVKHE